MELNNIQKRFIAEWVVKEMIKDADMPECFKAEKELTDLVNKLEIPTNYIKEELECQKKIYGKELVQ